MRRTRQLLQGALCSLLGKKNFDEISVQDITEAATVNRATFYDHYTDKFALLDALVASGFHQLIDERKVRYEGSCGSAAQGIIRAACDYVITSRENHLIHQSAFQPLVDAAITNAIRRVLLAGMPKTPVKIIPSSEMIATAASGAIYGAVKEWAQTSHRAKVEKIVPHIQQLVLPMLEQTGMTTEAALKSH
ncbi:MAG TPA: TetR family transcriptional regulator [Opitutaceae bacterium]